MAPTASPSGDLSRHLPAILADDYCLKILLATYDERMSIQRLAREYDIPIASCYRKMHELETLGLVRCVERTLTREGKRMKLYRSMLHEANISMASGAVRLHGAVQVQDEFSSDHHLVQFSGEITNEALRAEAMLIQ